MFCPQVFISLYQDSCHSARYFIPKQHYLKQEGRGKGPTKQNKTISLQASLLLWKENLPLPLHPKSSVDFISLPGTGSHDHPLSSVVSDSLWPHGLQHARFPCPSPTPRVTQTHVHQVGDAIPTISSSVAPFFSCLQSFPASGSFPVSQFFASGGQSIGVSASASVLPMNIQDWFPLGLTGLISLQSKGLSRVFSNTTVQKHEFFWSPSSLLTFKGNTFSSVQFSHSVVSDSWRPHESQHTRWWPIIGLGISTLSHT